MRYYAPGDEIYLFGFSRGAYVARFLAEMLDYVGLLGHGNEEMVVFAWKAFAQWQTRRHSAHTSSGREESRKLYEFMKGFRETFSMPVKRIRFLGLFDTVHSVPHFETAWMKRSRTKSKFPYTARSSARVIRHAVAIDERRAKFRQHLLYQEPASRRKTGQSKNEKAVKSSMNDKKHQNMRERFRPHGPRASISIAPDYPTTPGTGFVSGYTRSGVRTASLAVPTQKIGSFAPCSPGRSYSISVPSGIRGHYTNHQGDLSISGGRADSLTLSSSAYDRGLAPEDALNMDSRRKSHGDNQDPAPYRLHQSKSRITIVSNRMQFGEGPRDDISIVSHLPPSDAGYDSEDEDQDIDEVWFSGGHVDVGGGWEEDPPDQHRISHIPLVWMVREAMKAGLSFDLEQVVALGCMDAQDLYGSGHSFISSSPIRGMIPNIYIDGKIHRPATTSREQIEPVTTTETQASPWQDMMLKAQSAKIHDALSFSSGSNKLEVLSWNLMEYLPFKRMDLQPDGTWRPIRWPLPRGEVRDIPENARIHGSVIRRMLEDPSYRPGNLIVGGGGRGHRVAPPQYGTGDWECLAEEGDLVGEVWTRKKNNDMSDIPKPIEDTEEHDEMGEHDDMEERDDIVSEGESNDQFDVENDHLRPVFFSPRWR